MLKVSNPVRNPESASIDRETVFDSSLLACEAIDTAVSALSLILVSH